MRIPVGLAQFDVAWGDPAENVRRTRSLLGKMPEETRLVLLPELWTCSYDNANLARHAEASPNALSALSEEARRRMAWFVAGTLPWRTERGLANRAWLLDDAGTPRGFYDKAHLIPLLDEHRNFVPGDAPLFFELDGMRFACAVCYDLRFPEYIRALALGGIHAIALVAEWPRSRIAHWRLLLQARAVENQMYVLACNCCGEGGGEIWGGTSMVVAPDGSIIAEGGDEECVLAATLDLAEVERLRKRFPVLAGRRKELYAAVTEL